MPKAAPRLRSAPPTLPRQRRKGITRFVRHSLPPHRHLPHGEPFIKAITDNLPGLVGYWDRHLHCRFANRPYREWFGVPPEQIIGRHISELLGSDLYQLNRPYIMGALAGHPQTFERTLRKANGEVRHTEAHYIPHRVSGAVAGFFVLVSDVTEYKRTEAALIELTERLEQRVAERTAALQESSQRFQLMANTVKDYAIYFLDPIGKVASWTRAAKQLQGYSAGEAIGLPLEHFYPPDDPTPHTLLASAQQRGQCEAEGPHLRQDGSTFIGHTVLTALRDAPGQLRGYSAITHDVTALREAEALQRDLNAELERRVKERTQQLEDANRELEAFSYTVSHDLRAPLRHIDGFIELLTRQTSDRLDATSQRYLQIIAASARQMSCLIDDLLSFSRTNRAEMFQQTVNLDAMVHKVRQEVMFDASTRHIDWQIDPLPQVQGDPAMLHQMWHNLLANAVKYTRRQPQARIEVRHEGLQDGQQCFSVRDNGVGFDPQFTHRLFGVFQRLHRSADFEGTGIGLALVQRVVQRHGGSIEAHGAVNQGATFTFTLPATA